MSIDIDWEGLTTGPEGLALAESIRDFIHDRFQQIQLPRFIRSVEVHAFDFGKECPVVEIKDICDPLPEFYEAEEDDSTDQDGVNDDTNNQAGTSSRGLSNDLTSQKQPSRQTPTSQPSSQAPTRPFAIDTRFPGYRSDLSRSSTPGIPGGTSNLSYFHLPLSAGLSGTQTPLAAVAGGSVLSAAWPETPLSYNIRARSPVKQHPPPFPRHNYADPSSRPSTSDSRAPQGSSIDDDPPPPPHPPTTPTPDPSPSDVQLTFQITYTGTLHLTLTASLLLDYPMPSFLTIPLKLNITGLTFDGVALLAYIHSQKKVQFCFLDPRDADALIGSSPTSTTNATTDSRDDSNTGEEGHSGGLLREIRVESEIGQQTSGKSVLRNVGKVEKFVLEQVRRIFEEEIVWPSWWTFLL
ncbi:MAG: hypothetical protein Q9220_005247 [cf. Caloplaca sp. 1 TL-2023]